MERQQQFLDLTGDFVASVDRNYRIEFINRSGRALLGIDPEHDLGAQPLHVPRFHDPATWQALEEEIFPQVLAQGQWSGKLILHRLDGDTVPVQMRLLPYLDECGAISGFTAIGQDLRLRQALQTQQAMAERILDSTIEGIMVTDAAARIQRVNAAFTQITGYSAAEAIGQTPRILRSNHHDASFYAEMNRVLREHGSWQGEVWNRRKSGEVYLQWLSISALRDDNGGITHYVSIFHDLTEIRAKEAEIEKLAFIDPLTRLGNRHQLHQTLQQRLGRQTPRRGAGPAVHRYRSAVTDQRSLRHEGR